MRNDFHEILVERPRVGHADGEFTSRQARRTAKHALQNGDEDMDIHISMKGHLKTFRNKKELNENLKPLRRFLRSKVGQPWDDVYSEIMQNLNMNNPSQHHVWRHLIEFGEVHTKTYMENGQVMIADSDPRPAGSYSWRDEFYVHPITRTLEFAPQQPRYRPAQIQRRSDEYRYVDSENPLVQWHKIKGIWYEITLREPNDEEKKLGNFGGYRRDWGYSLEGNCRYDRTIWFHTHNNKIADDIWNEHYGSDMYTALWNRCYMLFGNHYLPTSKRQISGKEAKKIEALRHDQNKKRNAA